MYGNTLPSSGIENPAPMSARTPPILEMLAALVAAPSVSSLLPEHDQGNRALVEKLGEWLESLGFRVQLMPLAANPAKYNLLACLGSGDEGLLLSGHTDTVPCNEEAWHSDPFTLEQRDGRLYGLGSCDMKGFFPLAIAAAAEFSAARLRRPLCILATADEESTMQGARELVEVGLPQARYAIIGEPTGLAPVTMHKGVMMEQLTIHGRSGHSSNPRLGVNALEAAHEAMDILLLYRKELEQQWRDDNFEVEAPTLNLARIQGGDNPNRICGRCQLSFDIRLLPGMCREELRATLQKRLAAVQKHWDARLELEALFPGADAFHQEPTALVRAAEEFSGRPSCSVPFATEAPLLQSMGLEVVVLGPGNLAQAHQPNEYLEQERLQPTVQLLQQMIARFCS